MSNTTKNVEVRPMETEEIPRIREIDVSEHGEVVYKWVKGVLTPVPEVWERPSSYGQGWQKRVDWLQAALSKGGMALGAFDGGKLVAFAGLQYRLEESVAALRALWVSAAYRRHGLAARLVRELIEAARSHRATSVYASTCPSESAQGFYLSLGFASTPFVHRELYEMEPEDIHMALTL